MSIVQARVVVLGGVVISLALEVLNVMSPEVLEDSWLQSAKGSMERQHEGHSHSSDSPREDIR